MIKYRIQPLNSDVNTDSFDCGNDELNDFLQTDALQNQDDWLSITKVMYIDTTLIGYFTLIADTLHKERMELPDKLADYPYQKYPAIKLARLAIDKRYQHQGYGSELMNEFFDTARDAVRFDGGRFITVDAKTDAVGFYKQYGFHPVKSAAGNDVIPMYMDFFKYYNCI